MPDLLLELYSEEIPSSMQLPAINSLKEMIETSLAEEKLYFSKIEVFVSPRRMIALVKDLPAFLDEEKIEKKGPKTDANESALAGFLKSCGDIKKENLLVKQIDGKEFYIAEIFKDKKNTSEIIADFMPKILNKFQWPKSMKWGRYKIKWVRPLHNILCIFDNKVVDFSFGHLASNNLSFGHRFMSPEKFEVSSVSSFFKTLADKFVEYNHVIRKDNIILQTKKIAAENNVELIEDANLIDEVTGLVEYSNALLGRIDEKYMQLPEEVLITSIKTNQRYFCFRKNGKLANYFVTIANVKTKNDQVIIEGNQKVLSARLEDALFFWNQDLNIPLENNVEKLKAITFHQKLGNLHEKLMRMTKISQFLRKFINFDLDLANRAILLSKTDLVTEMVGEFPNLQGVIGKYYAKNQGEKEEVCCAIEEHYKPIGANDDVPTKSVSVVVSLADKFDSLVGLWIAGEKPTSSKDPYALRRAALGIIRISIENKISIPISSLIEEVLAVYGHKAELASEIKEFIFNRFIAYIKTTETKHDIIQAVTKKFDNIYQDFLKIKELDSFLKSEDGNMLLKSYLRASNIVTAEEKKDKKSYNAIIDESLMEITEEKILAEKIIAISKVIESDLKENNYFSCMEKLRELRMPIENFFEKVTVNTENDKLRTNRLNLLSKVKNLLEEIADFSVLEI